MIIVWCCNRSVNLPNSHVVEGCAVSHKHERNTLVGHLQKFAARKQVRITILSGDVHLAAVGRFFSTPRLKIPQVSLLIPTFTVIH